MHPLFCCAAWGSGFAALVAGSALPGCPPASGRPIAVCPLAHSSHQLELHGEVAICGRCGCYAGFGNGLRHLRGPCKDRPARRMAEHFRQLGRGRHPHGRPLQELEIDTLLELDCLTVWWGPFRNAGGARGVICVASVGVVSHTFGHIGTSLGCTLIRSSRCGPVWGGLFGFFWGSVRSCPLARCLP